MESRAVDLGWARGSHALQGGMPEPSGVEVTISIASAGLGSFLLTLLVGAIMVALAPEYTEGKMDAFVADPIGTFVTGFFSLLLVAILSIVLVVTLIGIFVAIPLIALTIVLLSVGSAIAFLAIGDRLVGHEGDWGWFKPLVLGAAIDGGLVLTGVGGIVSICISAAGFGTVVRDWL